MSRMSARRAVIQALCAIRCHGLRNDYPILHLRLNDDQALVFTKELFRDVDDTTTFDILNHEGQIVDRNGIPIATLGELVTMIEGLR